MPTFAAVTATQTRGGGLEALQALRALHTQALQALITGIPSRARRLGNELPPTASEPPLEPLQGRSATGQLQIKVDIGWPSTSLILAPNMYNTVSNPL